MADKDEPESVTKATRAVVERLTREAQRLRKLSELQALKENPREISVNPQDLPSIVAAQPEVQKTQPPSSNPPTEPPPN